MALIPGFDYDIFISYVHTDNESETFDGDGWIDQFYKYLDTKLNKHSKEIKIWWDSKNLDRSEVFDNSIAEAIERSAIMICLYSRLYPQSEYCLKELDYFLSKVQREKIGLTVGNRSRIIPVFLSNIPHTDWLEKIRGTSGFPFHDGKDYGDPLQNTSPDFANQMILLRNSLVHLFEDLSKELKDHPSQTSPETHDSEGKRFTIFLAEVNDSLIDRRDGIIAELKANGYKVITGNPSIAEAEIHRSETREQISNSQMAVHLLGRFPGRKVMGDPDNHYIQQQVKIGFETDTPQLIWISQEVDLKMIENTQHREFLNGLENATLTDKKFEFVRGNEGELVKLICDYAEQLKTVFEQQQIMADRDNSGPIKVLLDTHTDDFTQAFNLKKVLTAYDIDLIFNPEDGDPEENIKSLYSNISEAKKFIFLYGNENHKDWVDIRVKNTLKKLMDYDRYGKDIFIYVTPPQKDMTSVKVAQNPLVQWVDQSASQSLQGELLQRFLNDLKAQNP